MLTLTGNLVLRSCFDSVIPKISKAISAEFIKVCSSSKCLVRLLIFTWDNENVWLVFIEESSETYFESAEWTRFSSRSKFFKFGKLLSLEEVSSDKRLVDCEGMSTPFISSKSDLDKKLKGNILTQFSICKVSNTMECFHPLGQVIHI